MPIRTLEAAVLLFVKTEDHLAALDQDRALDQIWLRHHQVDRFVLRFRQRLGLEDRAAGADEIEKTLLVDVLFEKCPVGGLFVDVLLIDLDALLLQKTSGVAAGRSGRFQVKRGLRHGLILQLRETC
ncbi:MAG: hypothetical protein ABIS06_10050 [Vicinamibacterales bacterium]